ncbi:hypothetical protein HRbin33_01747 [bacterium HR33]|nr:hypothetical protein HRbin33_01747 [bacterium HR33]
MRRKWTSLVPVMALLVFGTACSDFLGSGGNLDTQDAADVADFMAATAIDGLDGIGIVGAPAASAEAAPPITFTRTFTVTRSCPAGGTVTISGKVEGEIDRDTRSGTLTESRTISMDDCARELRRGTITLNTADDAPIAVNGQVTIENGHHVAGSFTKTGTFEWSRSNGDSGSCTIDLTITWSRDGNTFTHTVKGTICGREIERTTTRTRG